MTICGLTGTSATWAADWIQLTPADEMRVRRLLHPLPHELRLRGSALRLRAEDSSIGRGGRDHPIVQQMIDDFARRWRDRHDVELRKETGALHIIAGVIGATPSLEKAAEQGLIDCKYLRERPNPDQAYTLRTHRDGDRLTLYVAANQPPGLYYGLLTLDQLLAGHSTKDRAVMPEASVDDWPDVALRGHWTSLEHVGNDAKALPMYDAQLRTLGEWRYNFAESWHLRLDSRLDDKGRLTARWTHPKQVVEMGRRYGITVFPGTGHLPGVATSGAAVQKKYPDVVGTPAQQEQRTRSLCYGNPRTQLLLNDYLEAIAREFDLAEVWMTELEGPRGVCHCPKCQGDVRRAFLDELQHLMRALEGARKVNPRFRMLLGLTQGSYPHHYEMLKQIPRDVVLTFYHGSMTYRAKFQTYNLPPSAQEMKRRGYRVGMCASPSETFWYQPFRTPQYCRLLAGEVNDRGIDYTLSQMYPTPAAHDFNAQGLAEFLWNTRGRTPEEFTVSWATRKGLDNPEETASVIALLEYPVRALHNVHFGNLVNGVVRFLSGKERPSASLFLPFEYPTHAELRRALAMCDEAAARARALKNPELYAGCVLVECWMTILERYAYCVGKGNAAQQSAIEAIRAELADLPARRKAWLDHQNLCPSSPSRNQHVRRYLDRVFAQQQAHWTPVLTETPQPESPQLRVLQQAQQDGRLQIMPLSNTWKFAVAADDKSAEQAAPNLRDADWADVRSNVGYGWEKQGFEGYVGYGWYRQRVRVPGSAAKQAHVYLLFLGVDEDAEVFIDGRKALVHNHTTVGGLPGATWDRPFAFDAKPFLKPDAANVVAVRVFNRKGMGGVWKPAYLIASEVEAKTEALVLLVNSVQMDGG